MPRPTDALARFAVTGALLPAAAGAALATDAPLPIARQNELVQTYCAACHDDARRVGGLSLEHFDAAQADPTITAMLLSKLTNGLTLETVRAADGDSDARAVEAVRSEAKAEKVVLVGHSMGTPVIVQYARMFPQHTAALVFVDGLVRIGSGAGPAPNPQQFSGPEGRKARENMIRGMFSASTTPAMQGHILNMMLGAPEATAVGAMKATWGFPSPKDEVIKVPVLGLYADHSRLADREFMKTTYPNLQYVEISGTGHFLMMEKPDEFNRHLFDFLKTLSF